MADPVASLLEGTPDLLVLTAEEAPWQRVVTATTLALEAS